MASPSAHACSLAKLTENGSYWLKMGDTACVIDPWLVGEEVDGSRWFNVSHHTQPVVAPTDIPQHHAVVVSMPYSDHCHVPTLRELAAISPTAIFVAEPQAVSKVRAAVGDRAEGGADHVCVMPVAGPGVEPLEVGSLRFWVLAPEKAGLVRYLAVIIADDVGNAVLHAPHGVGGVSAERMREVAAWCGLDRFILVATCRNLYRLPFWLGGTIAPGVEAAERLRAACPGAVGMRIHDEPTRQRGLVGCLAAIDRADDDPSWLTAPVGSIVHVPVAAEKVAPLSLDAVSCEVDAG